MNTENEKKVTDKLREAIMDYVYGEYEGEDLTTLAYIEVVITDIEDLISDLEKERDKYKKWWIENQKIVNAITKGS